MHAAWGHLAQALLTRRCAMCSPLLKKLSAGPVWLRLCHSEVIALLGCVLSTGCALHPVDSTPRPAVATAEYSVGAAAPANAAPVAAWWETMQSARLNEYVDRALRTSRTVEAAQARLAQADAIYRRAGSALAPSVDLKARYDHDIKSSAPREDYREIGPSLSWEIDLFGRLRSTRQVRRMERESRAWLLEGVRLTLSASVVEAYLGVIEQNELLRLLHSQRNSSLEFLRIIQQRFDQGLISKVDLLQQQSQVVDIESLIPDAEATLRVQENILQTLTGGWPNGQGVAVDNTLPFVVPLPSLGNPSELLARRPDLLAAKSDLIAADADIGRAIADRLPRFSFAADALLVDGRGREDVLATLAPSLFLPLLDWGNRRMEVVRSKEVYHERFALFTQAYLDAVLDVENSVVRAVKQKELIERLEERRGLLVTVLEQTQERYTRGLTDYLPVLTSLQLLNGVEQRLIRERRKLLSLRVTLHRALGGPLPAADQGITKG